MRTEISGNRNICSYPIIAQDYSIVLAIFLKFFPSIEFLHQSVETIKIIYKIHSHLEVIINNL